MLIISDYFRIRHFKGIFMQSSADVNQETIPVEDAKIWYLLYSVSRDFYHIVMSRIFYLYSFSNQAVNNNDFHFVGGNIDKFVNTNFADLTSYAVIINDGRHVISEEKFLECMSHFVENSEKFTAIKLELKQLLNIIKKLGYLVKEGVYYYSLDDIKQFFKNTNEIFDRIENNELTFPVPDFFDRMLNKACTISQTLVSDCFSTSKIQANVHQGMMFFAKSPEKICLASDNSTKTINHTPTLPMRLN